MKKISNPLTIIAIFAGLAEVACSTALVALGNDVQQIFVWFVMVFPFTLVFLFFGTLWFKPTSLYAPGDYSNEDNFLNALGLTSKLTKTIDAVQSEVSKIEAQISEGGKAVAVRDRLQKINSELSAYKIDVGNYQKRLTEQDDARVTLRVNSELAELLRDQAMKEGKSVSQYVRHSLERYLGS